MDQFLDLVFSLFVILFWVSSTGSYETGSFGRRDSKFVHLSLKTTRFANGLDVGHVFLVLTHGRIGSLVF